MKYMVRESSHNCMYDLGTSNRPPNRIVSCFVSCVINGVKLRYRAEIGRIIASNEHTIFQVL